MCKSQAMHFIHRTHRNKHRFDNKHVQRKVGQKKTDGDRLANRKKS